MFPSSLAFRQAVDKSLVKRWNDTLSKLQITTPIPELSELSLPFLQVGKRTRASLAYLGAQALFEAEAELSETPIYLALIELGCGLELYQASALIHDDIIDRADLRRGLPTIHRRFESFATKNSPQTTPGSALFNRDQVALFGSSAAILLGDLLLSMAEAAVRGAAEIAQQHQSNFPATRFFHAWSQMTTEVAIGQYLDLRLASLGPANYSSKAQLQEQILNVIRHKSAHYSVAYPLVLGGLLGQSGNWEQQINSLFQIGESWGIAFQLADDDLGVFGQEETTGKASGLDLLDGKRTLLWSEALSGLKQGSDDEGDTSQLARFQAVFGNPQASQSQIQAVRQLLISTGIRHRHAQLIKHYQDQGDQLLAQGPFSPPAKKLLSQIGQQLSCRNA